MKPTTPKSNVKIVVADDEAFMREIVVNALTSGGYREIRSVAKLGLLQEVVDSLYPDLLILNGDMTDGDSVDFVRRLRLFRIGRNPFVPIIMTAWNAEQAFVRKVVDSGADVLVAKPFAAGQLFARIDFLTTARPPFVVTSSYIGPDRRKSASTPAAEPHEQNVVKAAEGRKCASRRVGVAVIAVCCCGGGGGAAACDTPDEAVRSGVWPC